MIALTAFVIILGMNLLTFTKERIFLWALMAPVNITFGFYFATESLERYQWIAGVSIAILGLYCLYQSALAGLGLLKKGRENA